MYYLHLTQYFEYMFPEVHVQIQQLELVKVIKNLTEMHIYTRSEYSANPKHKHNLKLSHVMMFIKLSKEYIQRTPVSTRDHLFRESDCDVIDLLIIS